MIRAEAGVAALSPPRHGAIGARPMRGIKFFSNAAPASALQYGLFNALT
ncbi:MAG TPA: hypothetical protein VMV69_03835 [Pirellulales bacterium]|nr:hypothetical protein [Pirellulales bacterium]